MARRSPASADPGPGQSSPSEAPWDCGSSQLLILRNGATHSMANMSLVVLVLVVVLVIDPSLVGAGAEKDRLRGRGRGRERCSAACSLSLPGPSTLSPHRFNAFNCSSASG